MPRLILLLIFSLFLTACGEKGSVNPPAKAPVAQTEAEIEKEFDDLFNAGEGVRQYLKKENSEFVGMSKASVKEIAEDLYSAGALKIMVVDATSEEGEEYASTLLIELPKGERGRAKVVDKYNEWRDEMGREKKADEGGKYLILITEPEE